MKEQKIHKTHWFDKFLTVVGDGNSFFWKGYSKVLVRVRLTTQTYSLLATFVDVFLLKMPYNSYLSVTRGCQKGTSFFLEMITQGYANELAMLITGKFYNSITELI